jgi:hypothetical protein
MADIVITEDEAKLCIAALLATAPQHRCPENTLAAKLAERVQPGTTFYADSRYNPMSK